MTIPSRFGASLIALAAAAWLTACSTQGTRPLPDAGIALGGETEIFDASRWEARWPGDDNPHVPGDNVTQYHVTFITKLVDRPPTELDLRVSRSIVRHYNPFGLRHAGGNVAEWCEDHWDGSSPYNTLGATANLAAVEHWVGQSKWVGFLAAEPATRSSTSICLEIEASGFRALDAEAQSAVEKGMVARLEEEGVAWDVGSYREAPCGLRLWGGATVETDDLEALFPWLDWAWEQQH